MKLLAIILGEPTPTSRVDKANLVIKELTKEEKKGTTSFDELETFSMLRQTLLVLYGGEPRDRNFSDIKEEMNEIINEE